MEKGLSHFLLGFFLSKARVSVVIWWQNLTYMFLILFSFPAARGLAAARGFCLVAARGGHCSRSAQASHCGGSSWERGLSGCGFGRCGALACLPLGMWPLRSRGVEPTAQH